MSMGNSESLPNLRAIRTAILAASNRPPGFPLTTLRDSATLQKIRTAPHLQQFLTDMRDEAARAQSTPLSPLPFSLFHLFETTGERVPFENVYFDRRRRLLGLALTTAIDDTDAYLPALGDLIWELCNEYTWSLPAHLPVGIETVKTYRVPPEQVVDLFAAHTAHALAEVSNLLGERLEPWLHYRIRAEIERRIFQPVFYTPQHFEWESLAMNWAAVCGGCIGMAALILENDRERLVGMIDRIIRAMESFLEGFGADGGCPEGIDYWVYGFGFYTYFADMLYTFTDGQLDLFRTEHVRRIAAFPHVVSLGDNRFINYSDASEHAAIHPGLGCYLTQRQQQFIPDLHPPDFHGDPIYRWGNPTRDLLWFDATLPDNIVRYASFYLHDLSWVVDRRRVKEVMVAFSAKGGHNDEPHNHNDLGHFILHIGGESLLADLGAGVYTRQYFRDQRYDFLHTGSQGHSVPLINGQTQSAGSSHAAAVMQYESRSDGLVFALDLTRAYSVENLDSFVRSFDWSVDVGRGIAHLHLTDTFCFTALPAAVEECFISLILPTVQGDVVCWQGKRGSITMQFDRKKFEVTVETVETQTHELEAITVYRLRLCSVNTEVTRTAAFLFDCRVLDAGRK